MAANKKPFRDELKNFLIELGTKSGYKSYSGESEGLEVRVRKKCVQYRPDVIWSKGKTCYVFEIVFNEDWPAVLGKFTLAGQMGCSRFFVFRLSGSDDKSDEECDFLENLFGIFGKKYEKTDWHYWVFTRKETKDLKAAKKELTSSLRKWGFLK